jgi:hypothetical protein
MAFKHLEELSAVYMLTTLRFSSASTLILSESVPFPFNSSEARHSFGKLTTAARTKTITGLCRRWFCNKGLVHFVESLAHGSTCAQLVMLSLTISSNSSAYWRFGSPYTRAVCKVRGLTLLLRVGTSWRCGDGLFFEVLSLESDALLTTLHPLLQNVRQTVDHFEISCLGTPFSWLEKPRNHMGRDLNWLLCSVWKKWMGGTPLEHPSNSPDLAPCDFWAFPTMKRELRGKKFRNDQRSAARFGEVSGAL